MKKSKRLNWKQIFVHFLGMFLIALAFQSFAYLTNLDFSELIRNSSNAERELLKQKNEATAINDLYFSIEISRTIGFIVGFAISLIVSSKRRWHMANSMIALVIILLLGFADLLGWTFEKSVFMFPVSFLPGASYYIVAGCILLSLGILLLLLKGPIELKSHRRMSERELPVNG